MIKYRFIPQTGSKPKIKGIGILTIHNKEAMFFENKAGQYDKLLGRLKEPEVVSINSFGIFLKGYELVGFDKTGKEKYKYKEWYCSFIFNE